MSMVTKNDAGINGKALCSKRRNRVPTSCNLCRQRKIKCDRKSPCSNCIHSLNSHECKFEKHPWKGLKEEGKNDVTVSSDIEEELKQKVKYLQDIIEEQKRQLDFITKYGKDSFQLHNRENSELNYKDIINYEKGTPIGNNVEKDDFFDVRRNFNGIALKESNLTFFGPTSYMSLLKTDNYSAEIYDAYDREQRRYFQEHSEIPNGKSPCSDTSVSKIPKITAPVLPSLNVINYLLRRFFHVCCMFAPFMEEDAFQRDLSLALEERDNSTVITEYGTNMMSTIAALLVVLRFAYITLPSSTGSKLFEVVGTSRHDSICKNDINIPGSYITRANVILSAANCYGNISLRTIQAVLLLRIYSQFSPDGDDGSTSSRVQLSSLVQMGYFHGIHLDSTSIESKLVDDEAKLIWRNIWTEIIYMDASQAFDVGMPVLISDKLFYEHMPRVLETTNRVSCSLNYPLLIRVYSLKGLLCHEIRDALMITSTQKVSKARLLRSIHNIEHILSEKISTFDELLNKEGQAFSENTSMRAIEFCLRLDVTYKLYILYSLLNIRSVNSESVSEDISYYYRAMEFGWIILRIGCSFCTNPSSFFGEDLQRLISSKVMLIVYRTIASLSASILEIIRGKISFIEASKYFTSLDSAGLVEWLGVNGISEKQTHQNIVSRIEQLHSASTKLASEVFLCYRVSWGLHYVLGYFSKVTPELIEKEYDLSGSEMFPHIEVNSELTALEKMWNDDKFLDPSFIFRFE
ncbi:Piso0_001219 [Millerozyma farinosa CBS 7064]|uniref:Piso0_001219 protein n=1 Tax=Pichia sorbitophila (strain ATCC MYA-4447 / BCRC 22081 / CBS 7064 / NBRC 10061 / NRRL Y-12695) TaxID=559304 RepID=G8YML0_PICSO|nr:Piso0_001219 [Millerozyma farinosa CBS 7064]